MKLRSSVVVLLVAVLSVGALGTVPAQAGRPRIYHTIGSFDAFASYSEPSGCLQTDVLVSTSTAMYAAQPGPVTKQGLTSVALRVVDTCAVAAAAGGGEDALFDGAGTVRVTPTFAPRLRSAHVTAVVPVIDVMTDDVVTVRVTARWTASGPLERSHTRYHLFNRHIGGTNTNETRWQRPATAFITVSSPYGAVSGAAPDALLQRDRFRCMEVALPHHTGNKDWCFGFPA